MKAILPLPARDLSAACVSEEAILEDLSLCFSDRWGRLCRDWGPWASPHRIDQALTLTSHECGPTKP